MKDIEKLKEIVEDDSYMDDSLSGFELWIDMAKYKEDKKLLLSLLEASILRDDYEMIENCIRILDADTLNNGRLYYYAIRNNKFNIIKMLIDKEVKYDNHVIQEAIQCGDINIVKKFKIIHNSWSLNPENFIYKAVSSGKLEILEYFINLYQQSRYMNNYIFQHISESLRAGVKQDDFRILDRLLTIGANPNIDCLKPLTVAASLGKANMVQRLIDAGANKSYQACEAFRYAAANGHLEVVKMFLSLNIKTDYYNNYAIRHAIKNGHCEVAKAIDDHNKKKTKEKENDG